MQSHVHEGPARGLRAKFGVIAMVGKLKVFVLGKQGRLFVRWACWPCVWACALVILSSADTLHRTSGARLRFGTAQMSSPSHLGMLSGPLLASPPSRFVGMVPYGMWASDSQSRRAQHGVTY